MENKNALRDMELVTGGPGTAGPGNIYRKLSFRNMKRSMKDYLVYMLTMILVTALMYAFNSLIFQNELENYFEVEDIDRKSTRLNSSHP